MSKKAKIIWSIILILCMLVALVCGIVCVIECLWPQLISFIFIEIGFGVNLFNLLNWF